MAKLFSHPVRKKEVISYIIISNLYSNNFKQDKFKTKIPQTSNTQKYLNVFFYKEKIKLIFQKNEKRCKSFFLNLLIILNSL